jgi:serine/threonine protein kinase
VWEAIDPEGHRIAVKFMDGRASGASIGETRILQAVQKLRHPNLLRIDAVWSIPGYIVIAMELADGSLFDLLDIYQREYKRPLAAELTVNYLRQAASALDFLNAQRHTYERRQVGFLHRDVKPSNLLLVGEKVKLADFGMCIPFGGLSVQCTRAGTPDFAAPEVHRGALSESSDQYSLAVTYYYLRTGKLPFPAPPPAFERAYSYNRPPPDVSGVPPGEQVVLERALHLEPQLRWPSCTGLMDALQYAALHPDLDRPAAGSWCRNQPGTGRYKVAGTAVT